MKYPSKVRSFRFRQNIHDALAVVAGATGTNPNYVVNAIVRAWLAEALAKKKGPRKAAPDRVSAA